MDLLSAITHHNSNHKSEARRSNLSFALYTFCALGCCMLVIFIAPCRYSYEDQVRSGSFASFALCTAFVILELVIITMFIRALTALCRCHLIPKPTYSSSNLGFAKFLIKFICSCLSNGLLHIFRFYMFYAFAIMASCVGLSRLPFALYFVLQCIEMVMFLVYSFKPQTNVALVRVLV
ncbi:unnamed protein product [Phytomonas sp. Hart1]|nr:unnamed protein product [Phytomonas sp. Hart1]|eukprot:CCW72179.1 unnamed protein product [Phytomonas sp. isolate Hart1]